jgi:hypothetical protein
VWVLVKGVIRIDYEKRGNGAGLWTGWGGGVGALAGSKLEGCGTIDL